MRNQIERKAFERKEIAQIQLSETDLEIQTSFKDPYFLDFLGLKEGYLENTFLPTQITSGMNLFYSEYKQWLAELKKMLSTTKEFYSYKHLFD